jgi:hypothetical protein
MHPLIDLNLRIAYENDLVLMDGHDFGGIAADQLLHMRSQPLVVLL